MADPVDRAAGGNRDRADRGGGRGFDPNTSWLVSASAAGVSSPSVGVGKGRGKRALMERVAELERQNAELRATVKALLDCREN